MILTHSVSWDFENNVFYSFSFSECVSVCLLSLQVMTPRMDMTLAELQEMAARQQQQIESQQQLLASKVCKEHVQDERRDEDW